MITLNNINTPETFRHNLFSVLDQIDDKIYPLNYFFAYHLSTKNFSYLKEFVIDNPSGSLTSSFYKDCHKELSVSQISSLDDFISQYSTSEKYHVPYVYIGSKKSFRDLFSMYMPSAFDFTINYLLSNNFIKTFGSGKGSAVIFNSSFFDPSVDFSNINHSVQDPKNLITTLSDSYNSLVADNLYLINTIEAKNLYIQDLHSKISDLEKQNIIVSQITWR